jgi:chitodextrinase
VVSSNPTVVNGPFSTELWFRTTSTSGGKLIGFGDQQYGLSGSYDKHVYLSPDGRLVFGVWNGQSDVVNSDPGLNDGQWHHMVATQGSDGMRLYVDDRLVGQSNVTTNQYYEGYWRVGGDSFGGWPYSGSQSYINAEIDDVAIYGTALTADRVDAHYRATGRSGPDTVAPQVSITSPADGATISTGTVTVAVAATDAVGVTSVEVSVDGTPVATDTTDPYSVDWNATAGQHTIVATALDAAGNIGTSSTVTVTATAPDTTPPQTAITSPADGASLFGATTVTATATDDRTVKSVILKVDGVTVDTDTSAPYSFNWDASVEGTHVLTTIAEDMAGNTGTSAAVNVTVPADTTAPTAPTALATSVLTKTSVTLSWSAATDDRGVVGYRVVRDGVVLAGTVTALTTIQSGLTANTSYTYAVQAVDAAGNVSPDSASVTVTTLPDTALLFADSWARPDASNWGPSWTVSSSAGTARTNAGAGELQFTDVAGAFARATLTAPAAAVDTELLVSYRWNQTSARSYLSIFQRGSGGWQNAYRPRTGVGLELSSNSGTVTVEKSVGGTMTVLRNDISAQQVITTKQWLRLRVSGTTLQYRIWSDGQSEPGTWTGSVSGLDVVSAGQLFIASSRAGTNVGVKTVTFDDLTLTDLNP